MWCRKVTAKIAHAKLGRRASVPSTLKCHPRPSIIMRTLFIWYALFNLLSRGSSRFNVVITGPPVKRMQINSLERIRLPRCSKMSAHASRRRRMISLLVDVEITGQSGNRSLNQKPVSHRRHTHWVKGTWLSLSHRSGSLTLGFRVEHYPSMTTRYPRQ
jgi:hypothetical protein